jgi:hypothetical protein
MRIFLMVLLAAATHYAGHPLRDALHDLEAKGLHLIYSADVVRPEMIVANEPQSADPRRVLDELLREHRLRATDGPRGSLVIVHDDRAAAAGAKASKTGQAGPKPGLHSEPVIPATIDTIVVTPSRFTIFTADPEKRQFLSREELRSVPHLSDDLYRAINRLPGIGGLDMTARVNIRGGAEDEVEVLLDGTEVYDPFHLKDFFRLFSTIDTEAVGAVDVMTGGFPLQYGGRLSGVIDIASRTTPAARHFEAGVSLLNTRVLSSGTFRQGSAEWLVSIRKGYLREVMQLIDPEETPINPNYYDALAKLQFQLGERNILSANLFLAGDRVRIDDINLGADDHARSKSDDGYLWLNLRSALSPKLFTQTVASTGRNTIDRDGYFGAPADNQEGVLRETRSFDFLTLKNDTTYDLSDRNLLKGGFAVKQLRARYDYDAHAITRQSLFHLNEPPTTIDRTSNLSRSGNDLALYGADRFAVNSRLFVEVGARVDRQSYTADGTHVSPRFNAVYALGEHTLLRASWGRFYQPQGIHELQVEDGVEAFYPAQRADHALLGGEIQLARGVSVRGEVYQKRLSSLRPRFENIFDRIVIFPELQPDRLRLAPSSGSARGAEILLRKESGGPFSAWVSYARASVTDRIDDRDVPRGWDQRDSATVNLSYRIGSAWNFDMAGVYHSGWPTTSIGGVFVNGVLHTVIGPLNANRLPSYRRVDVRASRHVATSYGSFSLFVELFNALNFSNVTRTGGVNFSLDKDNNIVSRPLTESILGIVPSFGLTWSF